MEVCVSKTNIDNFSSSKVGSDIICIAAVLIFSGIWMLLTMNKLPVSTEGWYVVYADLILGGKVPYLDFELLFPPLYTYIVTVLVALFGESLLMFRIVGSLVFLALALFAYLIFREISPPWVAGISAIITVFMMQSEIVFVSYDYIRFYDLFNFIALYLLVRMSVRLSNGKGVDVNRTMILAGLFCSLAIMVRQSSGLIVLAYLVVYFVIFYMVYKNQHVQKQSFAYFLVALLIPLLCMMGCIFFAGAMEPFIDMTLNAGSKGSFTAMLFNWIGPVFTSSIKMTVLATLLAAVVGYLIFKGKFTANTEEKTSDLLLYGVFFCLGLLFMLLLFNSLELSDSMYGILPNLINFAYIFNLVLCVFLLASVIKTKATDNEVPWYIMSCLLVGGFVFAVGYGSGTSGGLSPGQAALNYGFIVCILLNLLSTASSSQICRCFKNFAVICCVFLVVTNISTKVVIPYNWWGIAADHYDEATHFSDIDYFSGVYMSENSKDVYESFVALADETLGENDEMYVYSQVPIFYTLAGKQPVVKAPVCWFDVCRDSTALSDLEYLKLNNPKLIVFADHGEYAMQVHEDAFRGGEESGQRQIYEWLNDIKDGVVGNYTVYPCILDNYPFYFMVNEDSS